MSKVIMIVAIVGLAWWLISIGKWYTTATDEAYFFDIGQGDAGLIIKSTPCRASVCEWLRRYRVRVYVRTTVLIDGGPDDRIVPALSRVLPWWKRSLDLVVVTHPHQDHIAGLLFVNERFEVKEVLMNPVPYEQSLYSTLLQQWAVCAPASIAGQQSDGSSVDDSSRYKARFISSAESMQRYPWLTVLLPLDNWQPVFDNTQECWRMVVRSGDPDTVNNDSIVIATRLGSNDTILWSGDSEAPAEKMLLLIHQQTLAALSPLTILKAPHHCSHSASTHEFVSIVRPRLVICSVGKGNQYGHPHGDVVERYEHSGAEVWRTDNQGTKWVIFE